MLVGPGRGDHSRLSGLNSTQKYLGSDLDHTKDRCGNPRSLGGANLANSCQVEILNFVFSSIDFTHFKTAYSASAKADLRESIIITASASGLYIFAAQSPTPPIPLFTLRRAPRDAQRKTRGQSGSLLLLYEASSSSASYRFSPAH
jgi:hypothetical protein